MFFLLLPDRSRTWMQRTTNRKSPKSDFQSLWHNNGTKPEKCLISQRERLFSPFVPYKQFNWINSTSNFLLGRRSQEKSQRIPISCNILCPFTKHNKLFFNQNMFLLEYRFIVTKTKIKLMIAVNAVRHLFIMQWHDRNPRKAKLSRCVTSTQFSWIIKTQLFIDFNDFSDDI